VRGPSPSLPASGEGDRSPCAGGVYLRGSEAGKFVRTRKPEIGGYMTRPWVLLAFLLASGCGMFGFNRPPSTPSITASDTSVKAGETVSLTVHSEDPDGDSLRYSWSSTGGQFDTTSGSSVVWTAPQEEGVYQITVTVSDGHGGAATGSISITVRKPSESWTIQLIARSGGISDVFNYLGMDPSATDGFDPSFDLPEPEGPPSGYLQLYFSHRGWGVPLGHKFSRDIVAPRDLSDSGMSWDFEVETDLSGVDISVQVLVGEEVPSEYGIVLEDETEGRRQDMREEDTYTFRMSSPGVRRFKLSVGST